MTPNTSASRDDTQNALMAGHEAGPPVQFVTFTLGEEEYGVDIMRVREIRGWTPATVIPNAPAHMRGVINLRGVVVPIFDLRARFDMGMTNPSAKHVVIIVDVDSRTVGLLVDTVSDIITISSATIKPVPDLSAQNKRSFLDGLVALDERMVALVSLDCLVRQEFAPGHQSEILPAASSEEATAQTDA